MPDHPHDIPSPWPAFWEAIHAAAADLRARRIAEGRDPETGAAQ